MSDQERRVDPLDETIVIEHPQIKAQGTATRRQLQDVWKDKGWKEVKNADPAEVKAVTPEGTG